MNFKLGFTFRDSYNGSLPGFQPCYMSVLKSFLELRCKQWLHTPHSCVYHACKVSISHTMLPSSTGSSSCSLVPGTTVATAYVYLQQGACKNTCRQPFWRRKLPWCHSQFQVSHFKWICVSTRWNLIGVRFHPQRPFPWCPCEVQNFSLLSNLYRNSSHHEPPSCLEDLSSPDTTLYFLQISLNQKQFPSVAQNPTTSWRATGLCWGQ